MYIDLTFDKGVFYIRVILKWKRILFSVSQSQRHKTLDLGKAKYDPEIET